MSFHMLIFLLLLSYEWTLKYSSHSGSPELGNVPQKYRLLAKTPVVDSAIEIMSEEEQTLINATIEVRDGQTIMKFTKLLKDPGQIEIKMGFNNMLWAYGISNTLSYHAERSTFTLDLSPSSDAAVKKNSITPSFDPSVAPEQSNTLTEDGFTVFPTESSPSPSARTPSEPSPSESSKDPTELNYRNLVNDQTSSWHQFVVWWPVHVMLLLLQIL